MSRRTSAAALLIVVSAAMAACLDEKKPATDAGTKTAAASASSTVASSTPADPDVESLKRANGNSIAKDFYVLSPEDNQSDDPSLSLKLVKVAKLRKNHVGIVMEVENHRDAAFEARDASGSLVDGDERALPVIAKPSDSVAPEGTAKLVWIFDASEAAKGSLEMRFDVPGTKTWPVVFSKTKPPDFKPTPNPAEGGPQGPGPMGPGGY